MESEYTSVPIVARHVPEPNGGPFENIQDALAQGYDVKDPITGMIEIGAILDGAFIPILVEKASLVHDAIELAKTNGQSSAPQGSGDSGSAMGSNVPTGNAYTEPPPPTPETTGDNQPQG